MTVTVPYIVQNPHIFHCPSIIYGVYERGVKTTFTLVNFRPQIQGAGPPLIIILNRSQKGQGIYFSRQDLLSPGQDERPPPTISQGLVIIFYKAKCDLNYRYIQSPLSSDSAIVSFPLSVDHVSVLRPTLLKTDRKVVSIKLVSIMFYPIKA